MPTRSRPIQPGMDLIYHTDDEGEVIDLLITATPGCIACIQELWGLPVPPRCPVYVMTSWLSFIFRSAPWYMKIILGCYFLFWWYDTVKRWHILSGWTLRYLNYPAVGIKPPRLLAKMNRRIADLISSDEQGMHKRMRNLLCHELTHAFTFKHRLPMWLNEGLAILTAEKYIGSQTVPPATLQAIRQRAGKVSPVAYAQLYNKQHADIAYHYTRGYWITRYLHETHPDLLRTLLAQPSSRELITDRVAAALGMTRKQFWVEIDGLIVEHFADQLTSVGPV